MSRAVVVKWNGADVPDELKKLPAGRYIVEQVDEAVELSDEEEAGIEAAMKSISAGRAIPNETVMGRARELTDPKR